MRPMLTFLTLLMICAGAPPSGAEHADQEDWAALVSYRLDGAGPLVVQIHGIGAGASSEQTKYQIDALVEAGFRVYSIDFPGWGESIGPRRLFTGADYVASLTAFLNEVVGEPAALIGHSLGVTYAIAAAAAHAEQVTALVLNAPVGVLKFRRRIRCGQCLAVATFRQGI